MLKTYLFSHVDKSSMCGVSNSVQDNHILMDCFLKEMEG